MLPKTIVEATSCVAIMHTSSAISSVGATYTTTPTRSAHRGQTGTGTHTRQG